MFVRQDDTIQCKTRHSSLDGVYALSLFLLYFSANALFVYKYGARTPLGSYLPTLAYAAFLPIAFYVSLKFIAPKTDSMKPKTFSILYIGTLALFIITATILLFRIDPYSVNVDRWSALQGILDNIFSGEYPWLARTHIGNKLTTMPAMFIIAFPFYLMGDVGYIQIFVFAAIATIVFLSDAVKSKKLLFLVMFLFSPAFWYEIAVRSDLVSNMMIFCMGLLLIEKISNGDPLNRPIKTGFLSGFLFCTRGVFIIPFTVFFFAKCIYSLKKFEIVKPVLFCASIIVTFAVLLVPFILWDVELFAQNNPFTFQASMSPRFVQAAAVIIAAIMSFKTKNLGDAFRNSAYCMFALMAATLTWRVFTVGWDTAIFAHRFDVTYYATMIPFIAFGLIYGSRKIEGGTHAVS